MAASGGLYYRTAAGAWAKVAVGAGSSSGGSATGDYIPEDGWVEIDDTLTYASATTFTVAGDLTATFQKGTKLKLTQTTVKYFYVTASAYTTSTTVTITGGDDYTLANAAITTPYYSYIENPEGFPDWFNYTPTLSASGSMTVSSPSITLAAFSVKGQTVFLSIRASFTLGGSVSNTVYATLPISTTANFGDCGASLFTASLSEVGFASMTALAGNVGIRRYDSGSWTTGASKQISVLINYKMA